jgi:hypothetical protein
MFVHHVSGMPATDSRTDNGSNREFGEMYSFTSRIQKTYSYLSAQSIPNVVVKMSPVSACVLVHRSCSVSTDRVAPEPSFVLFT